MGWTPKSEKASWWLFFLLPFIGVITGIHFSIFHDPILFLNLATVFFIIGLLIVWNRVDKKNKKE
jgi:hypothetical protein